MNANPDIFADKVSGSNARFGLKTRNPDNNPDKVSVFEKTGAWNPGRHPAILSG
jgi:hypothetical protein